MADKIPIRWAQPGEFVRVYVANSSREGVGKTWTWHDTFQNYDADYGWYESEHTQLGEMTPASQRMGRRDECMTSGACSCLVWASCWSCFHTIRRVGRGSLICCLFWRKLGFCHKTKARMVTKKTSKMWKMKKKNSGMSKRTFMWQLDLRSFFNLRSSSPVFYRKNSPNPIERITIL